MNSKTNDIANQLQYIPLSRGRFHTRQFLNTQHIHPQPIASKFIEKINTVPYIDFHKILRTHSLLCCPFVTHTPKQPTYSGKFLSPCPGISLVIAFTLPKNNARYSTAHRLQHILQPPTENYDLFIFAFFFLLAPHAFFFS